MGKLKLLPVLFVVVLSVCFGGSQILSGGDAESQLRLYRQRVGLMDSLIRQKCPGYTSRDNIFGKRQAFSSGIVQVQLEAEKLLYSQLSQVLATCQQSTTTWSPWKPTTPRWWQPTYWRTTRRPWWRTTTSWWWRSDNNGTRNSSSYPTSTPGWKNRTNPEWTTTGPANWTDGLIETNITGSNWRNRSGGNYYYQDCVNAISLTDGWRRSLSRTNYNGYENCDTTELVARGRPWFRFSGSAGNQLLDSCPEKRPACGASVAFWSPYKLPRNTGEKRQYFAYISTASKCYDDRQQAAVRMSVIKCGDRDFIYRYDDDAMRCPNSFCGMFK